MKPLIPLLLLLLLSGCGGDKVRYSIHGRLDAGLAGQRIRLLSSGYGRTELGGADVAPDGSFTLEGRADRPTPAVLADADDESFAMLFLEPGRIEISRDGYGEYYASGTVSNDRYRAVNDTLSTIQRQFLALGHDATAERMDSLQEAYRRVIERGIAQNPDNLLGVYLFSTVSNELPPERALQRIGTFTRRMQRTDLLQHIARHAQAIIDTQIGKPFIDLSLPDAGNLPRSLAPLVGSGRWVLVDFWATWCGPCMREMPWLQRAHEAYAGRGFEIYAVSLDNDPEAWRAHVARHAHGWIDVLAVGSDKRSPAADAYGIRSIPANFLISPEGVIVARNLRGEELLQRLAEELD